MSDYKPITGELRKCMIDDDRGVCYLSEERFDERCDEIDSVHAQLERENAALKAELDRVRGEWDDWESRLIELPRDADKLPIHVGDMLAGEKAGGFGLCEPFEVGCIMFGRDTIQVNDVHGLTRCVEFAHHYVPDTWERIIDDAIVAGANGGFIDARPLVARCKALAKEES